MWLVYGLTDDQGAIRYIGSTGQALKERLRLHRKRARTSKYGVLGDWLRSCPNVAIVQLGIHPARPEAEAEEARRIRVAAHIGHSLLNYQRTGHRVWLDQRRTGALP